jgi:hypothetical protein
LFDKAKGAMVGTIREKALIGDGNAPGHDAGFPKLSWIPFIKTRKSPTGVGLSLAAQCGYQLLRLSFCLFWSFCLFLWFWLFWLFR